MKERKLNERLVNKILASVECNDPSRRFIREYISKPLHTFAGLSWHSLKFDSKKKVIMRTQLVKC